MILLKYLCFQSFIYSVILLRFDIPNNVFAEPCHPSECDCTPKTTGLYRQCGKNVKVIRLTDPVSTVGEQPFYQREGHYIFFPDADASRVCKYGIESKKIDCAYVGKENVDFMIPIKGKYSDILFIISYGDNISILYFNGNTTYSQNLIKPDPSQPWPKGYINKAAVASNGALLFLTAPHIINQVVTSLPRGECTLFSILHGELSRLIEKFDFANGFDLFSCDGETKLYICDSLKNATYEYHYDQKTNSIGSRRQVLDYTTLNIPGSAGALKVDRDGYLWIVCVRGGRIIKLDPKSGEVQCSIEFPTSGVTDLAFGPCLDAGHRQSECLYVTTGKTNVRPPPTKYDGSLYVVKGLDTRGGEQHMLDWNVAFKSKEGYCNE